MMPARRFFVVNACIPRLDAEEEARSISIYHAGEPDKRFREILDRIKGIEQAQPTTALVLQGQAAYEETGGEIAELRARQRASAERLKQERQWLVQQQNNQSPSHEP